MKDGKKGLLALLLGGGVAFILAKILGKEPAPPTRAVIPISAPQKWNKYRPTGHGSNPWTEQGLRNVMRLAPWVDTILAVTDGKLASGFRSREVHAKIHAARGLPYTPDDPHLVGRAYDITIGPKAVSVDDMYKRVMTLMKTGMLGPLLKVGKGVDHLHLVYQ